MKKQHRYLGRHPIEGVHVRPTAKQTLPQYKGENDPYVRYEIVKGLEEKDYNVNELKETANLGRMSFPINIIYIFLDSGSFLPAIQP